MGGCKKILSNLEATDFVIRESFTVNG